MLVVGVDGTKSGWAAIRLVGGRLSTVTLHESFVEVVEAHQDAVVIAVDIPIGFPASKDRKADGEARSFVGPRASSVFTTAPRDVLRTSTHREASDLAKRLTGKGISQQAYALGKKILEVDGIVRPGDQIYEVHPEVSFCALAGCHLRDYKKTWNGLMVRRSLLAERAGIVLPDDLEEIGRTAAPDDLLDAAVAAWSALRIARGEAMTLPSEPEVDDRGRKVAIWY
jgi:predicted RNase H-like nuclease